MRSVLRRPCGSTRRRGPLAGIGVVCLLGSAVLAGGPWIPHWKPIAKDDLHDPGNPGIAMIQEPAQALSQFPIDAVGNQVNWVKALEEGFINPRTNIYPETNIRVLDLDILMTETGSTPYVLFPHRAHTAWLDCNNCHEEIFASKAGATPIDMFMILAGRYCGRCHGAVSFPLTECNRCHSVMPNDVGYGLATQLWPPFGEPVLVE